MTFGLEVKSQVFSPEFLNYAVKCTRENLINLVRNSQPHNTWYHYIVDLKLTYFSVHSIGPKFPNQLPRSQNSKTVSNINFVFKNFSGIFGQW